MKRTLAEIVQIVQKIKAKFGPNKDLEDSYYHKGFIGVKDLLQAERMIIKFIQWHALAVKMKTFLPCGIAEVKVSSSTQKLDLFFDSSGILRVDGRIKRSKLSQEFISQILLPIL